jgi:hypothetical protein
MLREIYKVRRGRMPGMTDVITTAILAKAGRTGISERRCNGTRRKSGMTMAREK